MNEGSALNTRLSYLAIPTWLTLAASAANGVNLTVVPADSVISIGSSTTVEIRIDNLGGGAAPALGAYDLDLASADSAVAAVNAQGVVFGNQLAVGGSSLQQSAAVSGGVRLSEVSLTDAQLLNAQQAGSFMIARVSIVAGTLGDARIYLDNVELVDAYGNPIGSVNLGETTLRVELVGTDTGATEDGGELGHAMTNACAELSGRDPAGLSEGQKGLLATCRDLAQDTAENRADLVNQAVPLNQKPNTRYAVELPHVQFDNVLFRLTELRHGGPALSASGINLDWGGKRISGSDLARMMRELTGGGAGGDGVADSGRLGLFLSGGLGTGDRDATPREKGFGFDSYGLTGGLDYRFGDSLILGAALGYGSTEAEFDGNPDATDVDGWSALVYGTWFPDEAFYLDWVLSAGRSNFDVRRFDPFSGLTARADTDGRQYALSFGGGYELSRNGWTFGPHARVEYARVDVDGYRESAVAGNEYVFDDQDATSLRTTLGAQISYAVSSAYGVFLPQARIDWTHEFQNDSSLVTAYLANDPTLTPVSLRTDEPDRDYAHLSLSVSAVFAGGTSGFISYEKLLAHSYLGSDWIQLGVRKEF